MIDEDWHVLTREPGPERPGFFILSDSLTGRTSEFESENSGSNPLPTTTK